MSETLKPNLREAIEALGAMPEGYCFCSKDRIGDDSKVHEPECADLRAALSRPTDPGEDKVETVAILREALDDAVATIAAVRATTRGSEWNEAADHFHRVCGDTLQRIANARAAIEAYEQARASTGEQP